MKNLVKATLDPLSADLWACLLEAHRKFMECMELHPVAHKNTKRRMIHDFTVQAAIDRLPEKFGVAIIQQNDTAYFVLNNVAFRFKKVNPGGRCVDNDTQQTLLFNHQQPCLPGLPTQINVYIGYVPDTLGSGIKSLLVVCRNGERVAWQYEIARPDHVQNIRDDSPGSGPGPNGKGRPQLKIVPKEGPKK